MITPKIAQDMRDERAAAMEVLKKLIGMERDLTVEELAVYDYKSARVADLTKQLKEYDLA